MWGFGGIVDGVKVKVWYFSVHAVRMYVCVHGGYYFRRSLGRGRSYWRVALCQNRLFCRRQFAVHDILLQ